MTMVVQELQIQTGQIADLKDIYITNSGSLMQIAVKRIKISGTSITSVYDYYANLETNKVSIGAQNVMKIIKVTGYR